MALRIYRAPSGLTYQYEEGEQPDHFVPVADKPKAAPKRRQTPNKARQTDNK